MCQSAHPFYGLTLAPEDKVRIHQEIFHLIYNSNGAFTHDEVYSMPIFLRYFYLRMLIEQREKENEQAKRQENPSKSKQVARPPSVKR
jgi:fido (protein-threonine AMPylation protein)